MRRITGSVLFAGSIALGTVSAGALPPELRGLVDASQPAGCSEYRLLFWDFYRAELWRYAEELPGDTFALALSYRTDFAQDELVESSIEEMSLIAGRPEQAFAEALVTDGDEVHLAMAPTRLQDFITAVRAEFDKHAMQGESPVFLTSPTARHYARSLIERFRPQTTVLSQNEIHPKVRIRTLGVV